MAVLSRLSQRLQWIHAVSLNLGASSRDKIKMYLGGIWFLLTDSGKSKLNFDANIHHFGQLCTFHFEDLGDFGLFFEVFISDPYDLQPDTQIKTIFDIGANIGVATLFFKMRFPDADIFCFEPDPQNYQRLKTLCVKWDNIHTYDVALWSDDATLTFYIDPHRGSSSSSRKIRERQTSVQVNAKKLDTVIIETKVSSIDILKFDIEGAEEEMFAAFHDFNLIKTLLGEVHGDLCDADSVINKIENHFETVTLSPFNNGKRYYLSAH